jgi:hypothetical protein
MSVKRPPVNMEEVLSNMRAISTGFPAEVASAEALKGSSAILKSPPKMLGEAPVTVRTSLPALASTVWDQSRL